MTDKITFLKREFLNLPGHHSIALVLAEIDTSENWVSANLTIGDCGRQITLEFDIGKTDNTEEIRNARHKLTLLREVITEFSNAWEEGIKQIQLETDKAARILTGDLLVTRRKAMSLVLQGYQVTHQDWEEGEVMYLKEDRLCRHNLNTNTIRPIEVLPEAAKYFIVLEDEEEDEENEA